MPTCCNCWTCCGVGPTRVYDDKPSCGPCCGGISCLCGGLNMTWPELFCCDWGAGQLAAMRVANPSHDKTGVYEHRRIMNQTYPGALQIKAELPKAPFEPGCSVCLLTCCTRCPRMDCSRLCCSRVMEAEKARQESEYTFIMENRLESNRTTIVPLAPKTCGQCLLQSCGCSYCFTDLGIKDNVGVAYFDHEMFDTIKVKKGCSLRMYNWKKWCCGGSGESLSLKTRRCPYICPCCKASAKCCCVSCGKVAYEVTVPNGSAQQWADTLAAARDDARRRTGASGNYQDAVKVGAVPVTGVLEFEKMER